MADPDRCLLVSDFTISGLAPFLATADDPPALACTVAPFDQVMPVLLDGGAPCWAAGPRYAFVWTRPEQQIPSFGRLLENEAVSTEEILSEVDGFLEAVRAAAKRVAAVFLPTWTLPWYERGPGLMSFNPQVGPAYRLLRMNAHLAERLAGAGNVYLLDAGRWLAATGPAAVNPKLWHLGKIAFSPEVFKHAAKDVKAGLRAIKGQSRKLIVLDLDDTLWGGIVGDIGWENLALGGHDPLGESFAGFQRSLKALTRRGVVLAVVSKNTEAVALEAIDRHPEMVLRRDDFVGWRINWDDKARNIVDLVAEVNLGLESVVFLDDNPAERARVREALPQVLVPEWPADKLLYEKALAELTCFDAVSISAEDRARTAMYVSDRRRNELKQEAQSLDEYLASLELQVICERVGPANLPRATQLLNKTNQMNLTTRRLTEAELLARAQSPENHVFVFRVADRFGDHGLTGLASVTIADHSAVVVDYLLSCRVMGRGVEQAMLHCLTECARSAGAEQLRATYRPTARNAPCKEFFDARSGLNPDGENQYLWPLATPYAAPAHLTIHDEAAATLRARTAHCHG